VDIQIEPFSVTGHHRNNNLLRYAPEDRSSPTVIPGKWLLKSLTIKTKPKNNIWKKPQIKNLKKSQELK
jgi:hypothetical protein